MPDHSWLPRVRRAEVVLGLLLAAVSFAPWWTRVDGSTASAWTGPHFCWLAVLLCLTVIGVRAFPVRALGDRWAVAGVVVALAVAGWGWLSGFAHGGASPGDGSHQLAWVLQDQGAEAGPVGSPYDIAWGLPAGLCLMALLLVTLTAAARLQP
ncbi:hypothetical protein ODJ79_33285 [Actinoplanes sp. KI2]|uniref:hypothetical protein n=1 Tax=Actinoplanes sp. KI2 TaxID=2983315 RepID=UPI0021D5A4B8|nr:hypothetical protein [Actinoplanes sp. KI2]MCU7728613.1 hypothetical protein [Actinoplanes sp. KI2]